MRLFVVVLAVVLVVPATAAAQPPGFDFVQPDSLALVRDGDERESVAGTVWLRNSSTTGAVPTFAALAENADGEPVALQVELGEPPDEQAAGTVERYRVAVRFPPRTSPDDVTGQLVARGAQSPAALDLTVGKKSIVDRGVTGLLLWPLIPAAILIVIAGILATRGTTSLGSPLPGELSFKDSYASQVTAVGALLGTVVAAGALPADTSVLSKQGLVALSLIFGVAIAVAAVAYTGFQKPVWVDVEEDGKATGKQQRKMQATVGGFLAASLITLWAAIGQLAVVWALVDELGQPQAFGSATVTTLKVFLLVVAVVLVVYSLNRIPAAVASERTKPEDGKGAPTADATRSVAPQAEPLQRMSLL